MAIETEDHYPIKVSRGNAMRIELELVDDDTGQPLDLTGYGAKMQARPSRASDTVWLTCATATDTIVLGDEAGTAVVLATGTVTGAIPEATGVYSLELWPDNDPTLAVTVLRGAFQAETDVTR